MISSHWIKILTLCTLLISPISVAKELSQYTARSVQKANELAQEDQIKQAIQLLRGLESSRAYDKAFVARMLGVFLWQDGQTKPAIDSIASAVKSGLLEDEQAWVTEKMLADLYLNNQSFSKANQHYYHLLKSVPKQQSESEIWYRLAQSHYQQSDWEKTLVSLTQYQKSGGAMGLQPYSLALGSQLQLKQWQQAIPTLENLIGIEPDNVTWWRQLVSLQIKVNKDRDALDSLALAKIKGVALSDSDRRLLAQLYAQRGIPERAAVEISQISTSNSDVSLLVEQASYWQRAKEWDKAIDVWQRSATLDSQYYWQVSQLILQQGRYQQALAILDKVKGRQDQVALAKARAYYKLDQIKKALAEAKLANHLEPSEQAQSWIRYLTQRLDASS